MGIGGAALYSLVLMLIGSCRSSVHVPTAHCAGSAARLSMAPLSTGRASTPMPHALDPEDQISDRKPQPKPF
jgi:hypothetical protein